MYEWGMSCMDTMNEWCDELDEDAYDETEIYDDTSTLSQNRHVECETPHCRDESTECKCEVYSRIYMEID